MQLPGTTLRRLFSVRALPWSVRPLEVAVPLAVSVPAAEEGPVQGWSH